MPGAFAKTYQTSRLAGRMQLRVRRKVAAAHVEARREARVMVRDIWRVPLGASEDEVRVPDWQTLSAAKGVVSLAVAKPARRDAKRPVARLPVTPYAFR